MKKFVTFTMIAFGISALILSPLKHSDPVIQPLDHGLALAKTINTNLV